MPDRLDAHVDLQVIDEMRGEDCEVGADVVKPHLRVGDVARSQAADDERAVIQNGKRARTVVGRHDVRRHERQRARVILVHLEAALRTPCDDTAVRRRADGDVELSVLQLAARVVAFDHGMAEDVAGEIRLHDVPRVCPVDTLVPVPPDILKMPRILAGENDFRNVRHSGNNHPGEANRHNTCNQLFHPHHHLLLLFFGKLCCLITVHALPYFPQPSRRDHAKICVMRHSTSDTQTMATHAVAMERDHYPLPAST